MGPGCPTPSLRCETGMLSMKMRVSVEKVMLVQHLRNLDTTTLARSIYEEQKEKKWPGLVKETSEICQKLGISNCNEDDLRKIGNKTYRKMLLDKCKEKDELELRKLAEGKTKCEKIMVERFGRKQYLSTNILSKARQIFKTRTKMQRFAANFPKDKKFASSNWLCRCQNEREQEDHLRSGQCQVYGDLKDKFPNLEDDGQLAKFFSAILERRSSLEEEDKSTEDRRTEDSMMVAMPLIAASHPGAPPV